ncbi:MAG: multicopper oxidase domain-containing protein [Nitrospirae bacterium]|nr:multicopper oxidase domain-containing protein [Nitrospirota bacterium]
MSFNNPAFHIQRQSVQGMEGEWVKMFDPPTASPDTPELLSPTNPVPEFIRAAHPEFTPTTVGYVPSPPHTVGRSLMHGGTITSWDGLKALRFFTFMDPDIFQTFDPVATNGVGGVWPGPTIRVPRGVVFHGQTSAGGPPPHTIHWHGIEPTPMNDGVGHCSMELGKYTYQWQPNFIGTYFYHCHRNTMQHFEFGLYGMLLIEPPDAFNQQNPALPDYAGGYPRRTAANFTNFPEFQAMFPGFTGGDLRSGDPHAMTIPYDVEALWVLDDRDSVWSDNMSGAFDTFPKHGSQPGSNDQFMLGDFHDFNPDYFFCTGVPFPAHVGNTISIAPGITVPPYLNSGVTGMQVSVNAKVNQTILIRALCAAYVGIKITFPIDVVIIAFDGRALGVPPLNQYTKPFLLPANTPYELSTARRFDVLMRSATPFSSFANVEFIHNRTGASLLNGRIPIVISA